MDYKIITLNKENLQEEHICCCMSSKTTEVGITEKKEWLNNRIQDGLRFRKADVRGKVFIEYIPAEKAWLPIVAEGYMAINCFWVSGSYKGKGYGRQLLEACEKDAKENGFKGVVAIVGSKKRPYLSDKSFFIRHGYTVVDQCPPYFELLVKHFSNEVSETHFNESVNKGLGEGISGIDIFYTAQCPFTVPYVKMLDAIILEYNYPVRVHRIESREEAQNHIAPTTTYSVFVDGKFYSHEILTPDKLRKLIEKQK